MSRKKKNHPEKTWPTQSLRAELAAITVAKRACDWATEVTWTVSYTAWAEPPSYPGSSFPLTSGRKRTTLEISDLKSENSGLPVELRMPKPEINMASSETCPRSLMEKDKV